MLTLHPRLINRNTYTATTYAFPSEFDGKSKQSNYNVFTHLPSTLHRQLAFGTLFSLADCGLAAFSPHYFPLHGPSPFSIEGLNSQGEMYFGSKKVEPPTL